MSKKSRLIPFYLLPASWGLAGRARDEAEAHYYLDGEALQRRLAEIRLADDPKALGLKLAEIDFVYGRADAYAHDMRRAEIEHADDAEALAVARLDVDHQHGRIDEYEHALKIAELQHPDGPERDLAVLGVEWQHKKITQNEYDKRCATLKHEPWIGIIDHGFDPSQGINGVYFEFDWNHYWIEYLRLNGYVGHDEDQIVEQWFSDVCRAQAMDDLSDEERLELRYRF